MTKIIEYPHTAITTWSGFVYQGKVALYHVLNLLNTENFNSARKLQLDSFEDFAILDSQGSILSLHQVKALKAEHYGSYTDAFLKLKNRAQEKNCNSAKFHLAKNIVNFDNTDFNTNYNPIELYKYGVEKFCIVDEIDEKIEDIIKLLLAQKHPTDPSKQSTEYALKTRNYCDEIVLKKVLSIHKTVHDNLMKDVEAAYIQTIPFADFISILEDDLNQKDLGDDYYFHLLRSDLFSYYQDYCIQNESISEGDLKKLSSCLNELAGLDKVQLTKFIRNLMPHRKFKFETLGDYKNSTFTKPEIQEAFLHILNNLKEPNYSGNSYWSWHADGKSYTPTNINSASLAKNRICSDIRLNANESDLDIMFENNCLITLGIDVDSVLNEAPSLIQSPESDLEEGNHIMTGNKVSLISINNACGIIND